MAKIIGRTTRLIAIGFFSGFGYMLICILFGSSIHAALFGKVPDGVLAFVFLGPAVFISAFLTGRHGLVWGAFWVLAVTVLNLHALRDMSRGAWSLSDVVNHGALSLDYLVAMVASVAMGVLGEWFAKRRRQVS